MEDIFIRDRASRTTSRVSVDSAGIQGNGASNQPSISADGRFVAFSSRASNLVPSDVNGERDVFVHDRSTGVTTLVSVDSGGVQGDRESNEPSLSADGRFVAFTSDADLVAPDFSTSDVFVRDRRLGVTTRVSIHYLGGESGRASSRPSISADGSRVAFWSAANITGPIDGVSRAYVKDLVSGASTCVSVDLVGNVVPSEAPVISGDGRFAAFQSYAVFQNGTSVCVHDLVTGTTELVSVGTNGVQGNSSSSSPSISYDGRFIAFGSSSTTFVPSDANGFAIDVFLRDRSVGTTTLVSANSFSVQAGASSHSPVISPDGHHVVFASNATNLVHGDTNGSVDQFVRDLP